MVCDRYEVGERVGSGGFAAVHRGVDRETGHTVAVKLPQTGPDATNDSEVVRGRFRQAYDALSAFEGGVQPTSMVRFVDGRREEPMCLVTEFVDADPLPAALSGRHQGHGADLLWAVGLPVTRALAFLHANDYVYLDVKPENVLWRPGERPVLVDFNVAESTDGPNDTLFHRDEYKAPEQVPDGHDADSGPHTDVYGVGKLLVYLATGQRVGPDETPATGVDLRRHGADVSEATAAAIQLATRADPGDRFRDCLALVSGLLEARDGDPTRATLTDVGTDVTCPVRPGDTVGRVGEDGPTPSLGVVDERQYVSPVQFALDREDDAWIVRDRSLNGTYVQSTGEEPRLLLSEAGYERLRAEDHPRVADGRPDEALRARAPVELSPVDPSYPVTLRFDPS